MKRTELLTVVFIFSIFLAFTACEKAETFESADELVSTVQETVEPITVEELKMKIDSGEYITMIDVREPMEHNAGYIPGAVNIPRGTLEFNIGKESFWEEKFMYMPEKTEQLVVFCKKGKRSVLAAKTLHDLGYQNVKYLDGGWKKWELTYPLEYQKNLDLQMHHEVSDEGGC